jgi:hypothetical protein
VGSSLVGLISCWVAFSRPVSFLTVAIVQEAISDRELRVKSQAVRNATRSGGKARG